MSLCSIRQEGNGRRNGAVGRQKYIIDAQRFATLVEVYPVAKLYWLTCTVENRQPKFSVCMLLLTNIVTVPLLVANSQTSGERTAHRRGTTCQPAAPKGKRSMAVG